MMRQTTLFRSLGGFLAIAGTLTVALPRCAMAADAGQRITVQPADNGQALVNPGMGWTLQFYSNAIENYGSKLEPSDTLDDWPGLSTIYLRVPWSFLEPQEGRFNWPLFDTPAQRWIAKGKKIAMRVSCCESWVALRHAQMGARRRRQGRSISSSARARGPAGRCGSRTISIRCSWRSSTIFWPPWPAVTTAIRTWRSSTSARSACGARAIPASAAGSTQAQTLAVVKRHIDLHVKHFHHTLLCISDDVAGPEQAGPAFPGDGLRDLQGRDDARRQHPGAAAAPLVVSRRDGAGVLAALAGDPGARALRRLEGPRGLERRPAAEVGRGLSRQLHVDPLVAAGGIAARTARRSSGSTAGWATGCNCESMSWPATIAAGPAVRGRDVLGQRRRGPLLWRRLLGHDAQGREAGIAAVLVDEGFDVRSLKVGPPGQAPVEKLRSQFTVAMRHRDPAGPARARRSGPGVTRFLSPSAASMARRRSPCRWPATTASIATGWGRTEVTQEP